MNIPRPQRLLFFFTILLIVIFIALLIGQSAEAATGPEQVTPSAEPLTPEMLVAFTSAVISLLFSYFPGLNTWYAGLSQLYKRLIMIALLILTAAGAYGIACAGFAPWLGFELACDQEGVMFLIALILEAIAVNQTVYKLSQPTDKVAEIKRLAKPL